MKSACHLLQIGFCLASLAEVWWFAGGWVLAINLALNLTSAFFGALAKRVS